MDNKIYYYQSNRYLLIFKDGKKLDSRGKFEFLVENDIPYGHNDIILSYLLCDLDRYIDLVSHFKSVLSNYKIKKGKRKFVYVDEFDIKYSDSSLSKLHFSFVPLKTSVNLIQSIKHEV